MKRGIKPLKVAHEKYIDLSSEGLHPRDLLVTTEKAIPNNKIIYINLTDFISVLATLFA